MSQVTEASDLGSVFSLLAAAHGAVRIRSRSEQVGMRLAHDAVGPVGIDHMSFRMDLDADVGPEAALVFGQVDSGAAGFRANGAERWYARGDIYLAGQPRHCRTSMFRDPTIQDRNDGSPATLRRAVAFIDEHAHEDITAADIGAAAFVTIRAVQLAFQRHMGTTPLAYLRRVRLARAHHDLTTADPATQTVTAIAYRWGFHSSSRFAAAYRQAYGIPPGHTLRR